MKEHFTAFYSLLPWCYSGLQLWGKIWEDQRKSHWKAIGTNLTLTTAEICKLKNNAVPNTIDSTLTETNHMFPNIYYMLTILAVLPITNVYFLLQGDLKWILEIQWQVVNLPVWPLWTFTKVVEDFSPQNQIK